MKVIAEKVGNMDKRQLADIMKTLGDMNNETI